VLAHHGVEYLANAAVRTFDGSIGDPVQQGLLAADSFDIVEQILLHPPSAFRD